MSTTLQDTRCHVTLSLSVLCIFFLLLGGLATSCDGPIKSEMQFTVRSVKTLELRAIDEAKKWKADAYLSRVFVHALPLDSRTRTAYADTLDFTFGSHSDPQHSYGVGFLLDDRIELAEWFIANPYLDFVPIEPTDWTIDSTDALRIAQENGGREFFQKNQTGAPNAFLVLERRNPPRSGSLLWYVGYTNPATGQNFRIFIDARTGVVVSKETE